MARLIPDIGGRREAKRRILASVAHSKLLYAPPVWANTLQNHAIQRKLFFAQRDVALRILYNNIYYYIYNIIFILIFKIIILSLY